MTGRDEEAEAKGEESEDAGGVSEQAPKRHRKAKEAKDEQEGGKPEDASQTETGKLDDDAAEETEGNHDSEAENHEKGEERQEPVGTTPATATTTARTGEEKGAARQHSPTKTTTKQKKVHLMTVKQLKEEAKAHRVKGYYDMRKPELRMKVIAARKGRHSLGRFLKPRSPSKKQDKEKKPQKTATNGTVRHELGDVGEVEGGGAAAPKTRRENASMRVERTPARKRKRGRTGSGGKGEGEESAKNISSESKGRNKPRGWMEALGGKQGGQF